MTLAEPPSSTPLAATRRPGTTRAEELRAHLADEIVQGALPPGTPLDETELARRFGVSRTPVREAIRELAASGLVEARAHRSALVALPSLDRLRGMFEVMAELEGLCARLAAAKMTAPERYRLQELHRELGSMVRDGEPRRYSLLNEQFHSAIYAGSHNDYLTELTLATRIRLSPFRRAQFRTLGRLALSHAEHDRVVTAILRGDGETAFTEMRTHIETVEVAYERYAEHR